MKLARIFKNLLDDLSTNIQNKLFCKNYKVFDLAKKIFEKTTQPLSSYLRFTKNVSLSAEHLEPNRFPSFL